MYIKILLLSFICTIQLSANDKILGKWNTDKSTVEIYKCGEFLCAKILSLKEPTDLEGKPKVDKNNPDPLKKTHPVVGLNFLKNFKFNEYDGEWVNGEIYNPEDGKIYTGEIKLENENKLLLNGHLKISKWLGKKQTWTRAK